MLDCPGYREPSARQWEQQRECASASPGQSFNHRGAFTADTTYAAMDIAMVNGSAFLALRYNPGPCPGEGWRLLAAVGNRGPKGEPDVGRFMRYSASEKFEIIELVEQSSLSIRRTLAPIGIPRSTFYDWYSRYQEGGIEALVDGKPRPRRIWNKIPDKIETEIVNLAGAGPVAA
jgi:transposase-like protein